jgi:hypothetical protein
MSLVDKIINNVRTLPESKQIEVLDFIEYLRAKTERQENTGWSDFSLSSAMRGLEIEESPYSLKDLRNLFHDKFPNVDDVSNQEFGLYSFQHTDYS